VWHASQALWDSAPNAVMAKFSVLPANLHSVAAAGRLACDRSGLGCALVAQAVGTGWLRLEQTSGNDGAFAPAIAAIRDELRKLGGFLVVYGCPTALKSRIDVWGPTGDAQPLMRRIKAQFDPAGILNPGRFVGGI
ncbi:MAG: FAD-binding oxidoreductase, partial [Acidobacteria bacterium]|nr:FAD-binding oxidoreductase [Acidobacteriota bacterium]